MKKMNNLFLSQNNLAKLISGTILTIFLVFGLLIFRDYGACTDDVNQIEGGHVIWKFLCQKFNQPIPASIADSPDLENYYNRFYGQAATFPTVIIEAIRGFKSDSSTILKTRHLWNFICYFTGLCCLCFLINELFTNPWCTPIGLLFMIFLPRIFGDIFYNDRDTMLLAWLMISLALLYRFLKMPKPFLCLLAAFSFAISFNTRMFGFILFIFILLHLQDRSIRKYLPILIILSIVIWIFISPIYWNDPIKTIPESLVHLSTKQRFIDTNNGSSNLFLGKLINETQLPWYYLPMYIFLTTPLATMIISLMGIFIFFYKLTRSDFQSINQAEHISYRNKFTMGMIITLIPFLIAVILFHPTLYMGWRHFYFLYLPIIWMAIEGFDYLCRLPNRMIRLFSWCIIFLSFGLSAVWIIKAHPYQSIYLNPIARKQWSGKLERDYYNISAKECMDYLLTHSNNLAIHITENTHIQALQIALPPSSRERLHTFSLTKIQPYPIEYLVYNYNNNIGNEVLFDYYVPIYAIERDGIKLSEIHQRSHNGELKGDEIIEKAFTSQDDSYITLCIDNNFETSWKPTEESSELILQFMEKIPLIGFEIFPENYLEDFPDIKFYSSEDGTIWSQIIGTRKGTNGIQMPIIMTKWIKIQYNSFTSEDGIRELLFYRG